MSGLTVTTPWYPTPYNRMAGSFVAAHARLAAGLADPVRVVHGLEWPGGTPESAPALRPAFDAVLDRVAGSGGLRLTGAVGPVDRVPVFTVGGAGWAERAEALVRDVRRAIGGTDSLLVHGHVGYLGGLLAARIADPSAKVFATEHSTALREVLADPGSRDHYAELLDRATTVFCVSGLLRDQVLERVADPGGRLEVLHNPVDFAGAPRRATAPNRLARWVFVGGLHERKGVVRLVRAFCIAAREDAEVTLTMLGAGALADRLVQLATEAGVADRLHLPGVLRHGELLSRLPEFDLLLAPSTYETFHLAVTEAVAAGVPVIVTRSGGPQESLAGVEHQVGRFVDVEESPDALVDAWRDLGKNLDSLDLDAARATLDARYGVAAVTARLARAYGASPELGAPLPVAQPPRPTVERIVLLAVSGWRRYSVEAELAASRRLDVPTTVVSGDPQIVGWSEGLDVVAPQGVDLVAAAPAEPLEVRARRVAGRLRRRLKGQPVAQPPRGARLDARFLDGATLVVADCQSMPLAQSVIAAHSGVRPVFELDRRDRIGPPSDGSNS